MNYVMFMLCYVMLCYVMLCYVMLNILLMLYSLFTGCTIRAWISIMEESKTIHSPKAKNSCLCIDMHAYTRHLQKVTPLW